MPERLIAGKECDPILERQHKARYQFASGYVRDKSVIDIACGTGYGSSMLFDAGAKNVLGMDISDEALGYAKQNFRHPGLDFIRCDAEHQIPGENVDVVVSFETIEHLREPKRFLSNIGMVLCRGGVLIISTPVRQRGSLTDKPENPFHQVEWSIDEFKRLLEGFFRIEDAFFQYNYKKLCYPGSRTISKVIARCIAPGRARVFGEYRVMKDPVDIPLLPVSREYMVFLCRQRDAS